MLVTAIPIFTAVIAATVTRTWPRSKRLLGLAIGLLGIVLLTAPDLSALGGEAIGVVMVLAGVLSYALASTLYAPLQQTYGALPVTLWLLVVSSVVLLPLGLVELPASSAELVPLVSLVILGVVGTGMVWALFVAVIGKVGAVRASIVGYFIPIFALLLGVFALGEHVEAIQIAGVLVALLGGYLISRGADG
jgi:drug/metabolite transporter (DMT)-like permease